MVEMTKDYIRKMSAELLSSPVGAHDEMCPMDQDQDYMFSCECLNILESSLVDMFNAGVEASANIFDNAASSMNSIDVSGRFTQQQNLCDQADKIRSIKIDTGT